MRLTASVRKSTIAPRCHLTHAVSSSISTQHTADSLQLRSCTDRSVSLGVPSSQGVSLGVPEVSISESHLKGRTILAHSFKGCVVKEGGVAEQNRAGHLVVG